LSSGGSESVEEVRELVEVLRRISDRLGRLSAVQGALIYIAWALWVSSLMLVLIAVEVLDLPGWIYNAYFATTFVFMAVYAHSRLPRTLRLLHELQSLERTRTSPETWRRFARAEATAWGVSFSIMVVLTLLYREPGSSAGLLVALGIGNLSMYLLLWRFTGTLARGAVYLSLLLVLLAPVSAVLTAIDSGVGWVFTSVAIIFVYLLLALYNIMAAFR